MRQSFIEKNIRPWAKLCLLQNAMGQSLFQSFWDFVLFWVVLDLVEF